jgi:hypothetical protein
MLRIMPLDGYLHGIDVLRTRQHRSQQRSRARAKGESWKKAHAAGRKHDKCPLIWQWGVEYPVCTRGERRCRRPEEGRRQCCPCRQPGIWQMGHEAPSHKDIP